MNTIRFNCDKCQRHWLFPEFRVHKMRGMCVLDPMAENSVDKLKGNVNNNDGNVQRRPTVAPKGKGGTTTMTGVTSNTGAAVTGHIYILERDTKFVYEY